MPARLIFALLLLASPLTSIADERVIEPRAQAALDEMVRAYRRLKSLDQESVYDSRGSSAARIMKTRLLLEKPNRLLLEIQEREPTKGSIIRRFVSDGKELYSYNELQGYFVKDKAPRNMDGFRELAPSIEMAAITGINPFAALSEQARSIKLESPAPIGEVLCDVVFVDVGDDLRTGEVRFFIGREDRLLRKFIFDSKPIPKPEPEKKEKKLLPDLNAPPEEELEPLAPLDQAIPVQFSYLVTVRANPKFSRDTFLWLAPPGALQLLGANGLLNQKGSSATGSAGGQSGRTTPTPYTDLTRITKPLHAKDLMEKARKQQRR